MFDSASLQSQAVPLSQCTLWQLQKNYFNKRGIEAWAKQVPFYITSNPYIANSYAQVIIRFVQDCLRLNQHKRLEPFYIIELGAGSGTFSFYVLKRLLELWAAHGLLDIKLVYVMTDFTKSNINYWLAHPALKVYFEQGLLDVAQFDAEQDQSLLLLNSKLKLSAERSAERHNPFIVIANYVFDSLTQDVFAIQEHQLQEGLVTVTTPEAEFSNNELLNKVTLNYTYQAAKADYYGYSYLDTLLEHYTQHYNDMKLLLPVGSLRCIENLRRISHDKLLLLTTDKGYSSQLSSYACYEPEAVWHGSFSFMVNFHAIGQYIKLVGGDCYYQATQQAIASCAFTIGNKWHELTETRQALDCYFEQFSPGNLFSIYQHINITQAQTELSTLLAYLHLSRWDPKLFDWSFNNIIKRQLNKGNIPILKDLLVIMPKLAANFYYLPAQTNTLQTIGNLLQYCACYPEAITYYQEALYYQPDSESLYYNMGVCYYQIGDLLQAEQLFNRIIAANPRHIKAHGWLAKLEALQTNLTP